MSKESDWDDDWQYLPDPGDHARECWDWLKESLDWLKEQEQERIEPTKKAQAKS